MHKNVFVKDIVTPVRTVDFHQGRQHYSPFLPKPF